MKKVLKKAKKVGTNFAPHYGGSTSQGEMIYVWGMGLSGW